MKKTLHARQPLGMIVTALTVILALCFVIPTLAVDITPEDPFEVTETLVGIDIEALPAKTIYDIGAAFDASGLKLKLKYNSGRTETVDADASMCSGFDSTAAGKKTVTVTHRAFTASFEVEVRTITGIAVKTSPAKTEYFVGEELDLDGLVLEALYSAGASEDVKTGYTLSGGSRLDNAGEHDVTVTWRGYSATFKVTVNAPVATGASLTTLPTKIEYAIGDKFDGSGAVFTVKYNNGTTEKVSEGITFSGFSSENKGEVTVTATLGKFSDTFTVTVKYAAHEHVAGGDRVIVKEATCTESGLAVRYCKVCGEIAESAKLKMLSHSYGDWKVTKEATTAAAGEKMRTCSDCGAAQTMTIDALSSRIDDGKNGSAVASGDYIFPAEAQLIITNVSGTMTATELKKLNDTASANGLTVAMVYQIVFKKDGREFIPDTDITYQVSVAASELAAFDTLRVIHNNKLANATLSGGYISFKITSSSGVFAIAGLKSTAPVTTEEATSSVVTSPAAPVTSAPDPAVTSSPYPDTTTSPADTDTSSPESTTLSPETRDDEPAVTSSPSAETTDDSAASGDSKLGSAIKTIIIVIVIVVVIGALFELIYLYLKNKLML